jgi:hypothetical protein
VYSPDDIVIGKLMVDMDQLGFGPRDGFDPEDLRQIVEFVKTYVVNVFRKYYENNLQKLTSKEYAEKSGQYHEVISLFFYHVYRKFVRQAGERLLETNVKVDD